MKFSWNGKEVKDIQGIVNEKELPVLGHFLLDIQNDSSFIYATDLQLSVKEPIKATTIQEHGKICVPTKKLLEIIRELDGDITFETHGNWLRGISGKTVFKIACLPPEEFPAWPGIETEEEIVFNSEELVEIIEKTIYSAGEADMRYTLNGLLFHIKPGGVINVVGTDGHRLALIIKETGHSIKDEKKLIIPRKAVGELRKFAGLAVSKVIMKIGKNHVLFKIDETDFLVRLIEGTYPNYEQVIPVNDKVLKIKREEFLKTLKRVSIMSREYSSAVRMDISSGLLAVASTNPDLGEARDEIEVDYNGDAMEIGFNARYIIDSLSVMKGDVVSFALHDSLSPSLLMEEGEENYKCVIMPMKL